MLLRFAFPKGIQMKAQTLLLLVVVGFGAYFLATKKPAAPAAPATTPAATQNQNTGFFQSLAGVGTGLLGFLGI